MDRFLVFRVPSSNAGEARMNLYLDKVKAHGEASRREVEAQKLARSPLHSSGYGFKRFHVRSKWRFFYAVYEEGASR